MVATWPRFSLEHSRFLKSTEFPIGEATRFEQVKSTTVLQKENRSFFKRSLLNFKQKCENVEKSLLTASLKWENHRRCSVFKISIPSRSRFCLALLQKNSRVSASQSFCKKQYKENTILIILASFRDILLDGTVTKILRDLKRSIEKIVFVFPILSCLCWPAIGLLWT